MKLIMILLTGILHICAASLVVGIAILAWVWAGNPVNPIVKEIGWILVGIGIVGTIIPCLLSEILPGKN